MTLRTNTHVRPGVPVGPHGPKSDNCLLEKSGTDPEDPDIRIYNINQSGYDWAVFISQGR